MSTPLPLANTFLSAKPSNERSCMYWLLMEKLHRCVQGDWGGKRLMHTVAELETQHASGR